MNLESVDTEKRMHLSVISLSDISPILSDGAIFESDRKLRQDFETCISWHIMELRTALPKSEDVDLAVTTGVPQSTTAGDVLTLFFLSPLPGQYVEEFEAFSDLEHLPYLSRVPGWKGGSRYRLVKSYGEVDDLEGAREQHVKESCLGDFGNFTW